MGNTFKFRMPAGIPGDVNRSQAATVEGAVISGATPGKFSAFGLAGFINAADGLFRVAAAGDASVYGLLVRPYPTQSSQDPLGTSTPQTSGMCDVMKRGYMTVKLYGATAAVKGGAVFVRLAVPGTGVIGGLEAAADGGNTLALGSNYYFMGPADADGNVEVAFNI